MAKDAEKGGVEHIWATVLALALLQQRSSQRVDEWHLMAEKAQAWLLTTRGQAEVEGLIEAANTALPGAIGTAVASRL